MAEIEGYIGKHKGKMVFVLGTGPSLHHVPPHWMSRALTIATNSAIMRARVNGDYYLSCDFGMTVWKSWLYLRYLPCKLILYNVDVGWRHLETLTNKDTFEGIDESRITYFDMHDEGFAMTGGPPLARGSSSVHVAVEFAHMMGCSPIVLLGCDCKYDGDKYHFYDYPSEPKDDYRKDEYRDFKPRDLIQQQGDSNKYLDGHVKVWQKIRDANPDVNIIDCSGGSLTMFPQMGIGEVLDKYGN
jgi:hypothetical protein